jgi:hypothetical protein
MPASCGILYITELACCPHIEYLLNYPGIGCLTISKAIGVDVAAAEECWPSLVIDLPCGRNNFANPNNGCLDSVHVSDNGLSKTRGS